MNKKAEQFGLFILRSYSTTVLVCSHILKCDICWNREF